MLQGSIPDKAWNYSRGCCTYCILKLVPGL
jgi:hypothetical protein